MGIKNIVLTSKDLQVTLTDVSKVEAVYIDKASNYGNVYSSTASDHTFTPSYTYSSNVLKIIVPNNKLTFFTITIFADDQILVGMYLNQFSLFKAKSKYLQVFEGCCGCNSNHNLMCIACNQKVKRNNVLAYMLRLNLFQQCYINGNVQLAVKYYIDACRVYDLDNIYFEFLDFESYYNGISGNMEDLFNTLNNWIKGNACPCEQRVLESLLIADLYSLLFGGMTTSKPDPIEPEQKDYTYYGYLTEYDISNWQQMKFETYDFSLLTSNDISKGIANGTITKSQLSSKQFNLTMPDGVGCFFVLIPDTSSKVAQKWNGINDWVNFEKTGINDDGTGMVSNGENTIIIDGITYKIYGEDYLVPGERTIKIS